MAGDEKLILQLLQEVRDEQQKTNERFANFDKLAHEFDVALKQHIDDSATRHKEIKSAFPAEDTEGHRRYHESVIEWRELRNKIVRECLIHAAKVGGLGAMGWLAYAIWTALKLELTKG